MLHQQPSGMSSVLLAPSGYPLCRSRCWAPHQCPFSCADVSSEFPAAAGMNCHKPGGLRQQG